MSSYIVDKREYVKAAGLMYGIEESKRDSHQYFLDVCRKEFEHCYALNVISVNEQYGDSIVPDEESYDEEFEKYRKLGVIIGNDGYASTDGIIYKEVEGIMTLKDLRIRLWRFFRSALYQIEDKACGRAVSEWFFTCISKLYERDLEAVEGWSGEVELKDELKQVA